MCSSVAPFTNNIDARCDSTQKASTPCKVESIEVTIGKCVQTCSVFGSPFIGTCKCELTGAESVAVWTTKWVKKCK